MTTFVTLAISDMMFPESASMKKSPLTPEQVSHRLDGVVSVVNPSHKSTLDVLKRKFGFTLPIPEKAPKIALVSGDELIVLQAQLPRLNEGEVHSLETVENAVIKFSLWEVN